MHMGPNNSWNRQQRKLDNQCKQFCANKCNIEMEQCGLWNKRFYSLNMDDRYNIEFRFNKEMSHSRFMTKNNCSTVSSFIDIILACN